jgi:hypothetical protein
MKWGSYVFKVEEFNESVENEADKKTILNVLMLKMFNGMERILCLWILQRILFIYVLKYHG